MTPSMGSIRSPVWSGHWRLVGAQRPPQVRVPYPEWSADGGYQPTGSYASPKPGGPQGPHAPQFHAASE